MDRSDKQWVSRWADFPSHLILSACVPCAASASRGFLIPPTSYARSPYYCHHRHRPGLACSLTLSTFPTPSPSYLPPYHHPLNLSPKFHIPSLPGPQANHSLWPASAQGWSKPIVPSCPSFVCCQNTRTAPGYSNAYEYTLPTGSSKPPKCVQVYPSYPCQPDRVGRQGTDGTPARHGLSHQVTPSRSPSLRHCPSNLLGFQEQLQALYLTSLVLQLSL